MALYQAELAYRSSAYAKAERLYRKVVLNKSLKDIDAGHRLHLQLFATYKLLLLATRKRDPSLIRRWSTELSHSCNMGGYLHLARGVLAAYRKKGAHAACQFVLQYMKKKRNGLVLPFLAGIVHSEIKAADLCLP